MAMVDIPEISCLSVPEKILLVEDLWENISTDESGIPVPQSHRNELDARLAKHRGAPGDLLTLQELQDRIAGRK
ncbi:MAG: addiction module protein [Armatimonadetes bacterium CG2_30_59_28]|nr:addiction module protein [Armatimonadota bacterium]OIO94484.1 MAG: addiction module protein [Armatimonadetes bacterium CG2_30_59_28]PIU66224.1 MAG: addiction module protein [Armatimonadetes bacterium CG07_land_8_20_14_0_80_59_28]PIX40122.1 MAG: addiction module protein [Armatimonadetes bacterium CG_4_8_14_3_um_filter_58_9]PIY41073.1 MAG: addiction module protein [Armatimonadetes bacterium CG_4_10_14_3_um_filter_59_10]